MAQGEEKSIHDWKAAAAAAAAAARNAASGKSGHREREQFFSLSNTPAGNT